MEMLSHNGNACAQPGSELARAEAGQGSQQRGGLRQVLPQLGEQRAGLPEEHARVPVEIARRHIAFGLRQRRLLAETVNGNGRRAGLGAARELDIAVAGFRPARPIPTTIRWPAAAPRSAACSTLR